MCVNELPPSHQIELIIVHPIPRINSVKLIKLAANVVLEKERDNYMDNLGLG
jgi:hypothetical protein